MFGEYRPEGTERLELCSDGITFPTNCDINERNRLSLIFFYIGNIVIGVGAASLYTVGPSYIDDIVQPKYVSIHLGFFLAMAVLGPALGFGVGAGFLSIYVDFWIDTDLFPGTPGYVGAWWLCFLLSTVLCWLLAVPLLMFPKLLPDSHLVRAEREKEMAQKRRIKKWSEKQDESAENVTMTTKIISFPQYIFQVLTTPSWIFITAALSFSTFSVSGFTAFAPKYYETQFSLPPSLASLAAGLVGMCMVKGVVNGGPQSTALIFCF